MKFEFDKQIVRFIPETKEEEAALDRLWKYLVECEGESRKLVPLGIYMPGTSTEAQFQVEGYVMTQSPSQETVRYYCPVCNRYEEIPAGSEPPVCCNQPMVAMD
ncbi:hypothetical protein G4V39_02060 [Thermosulfuriphilus ammonigenes]|uniref:Uncharacterized protein n=1 Tax=Thermosulfuriphilus ammonigenes TaxID=1936021 RepID=A0A6G7PU35_9BACT|nr:hypothetical protein [Thermosulfuriphilus ammonigenes]MBA2848737.1 hypothetical protein [Thermosulfuriphilus ammonigenes]QIJ71130.1 hypothetical protein G4V39_02060 [Thermosulfuriphilus ammonigenes]